MQDAWGDEDVSTYDDRPRRRRVRRRWHRSVLRLATLLALLLTALPVYSQALHAVPLAAIPDVPPPATSAAHPLPARAPGRFPLSTAPSALLTPNVAAPLAYHAFLTPATAQPLRAATTADAVPIYGVQAELEQPLGPYRTTVSIRGVPDLQRLRALHVPIIAVTLGTATVIVFRHTLAELAREQFFPTNTDLVTNLQGPSIRRWVTLSKGTGVADTTALPAAPTAAALASASSLDSDGDGLTNIEEGWWCTDPYNPDSNGDGVSDGQTVQNLLDWLQHRRPDRGPGLDRPFSGWPVNHPGCLDSDFDSVPDAAETFMLGLNPTLESTAHDKYDDGQKLFGVTYCPGGVGGGCGYGALPPAQIPFAQLPSWVKAPYDSPFVAAFPVITVAIVPNSLTVSRVTTITTAKGQMSQTQQNYSTAVTNETSTSIANSTTWNNWQEVSQAVSSPLGAAPAAFLHLPGRARAAASTSCSTVWQRFSNRDCFNSILWSSFQNTLNLGGAALSTALDCVPGEDVSLGAEGPGVTFHVDNKACVHSLVTNAAQLTCQNGWSSGASCTPNAAQQQPTYGPTSSPGTSASDAAVGQAMNNINVDLQGLSPALNGIQYAIDQQGNLLAQGLHDVSYAIAQPRITTTNTTGQSYGGSQTTTQEVSQAQTVTNGDAFTTGSDWSTATAVNSAHAADMTFSYTISNTGTDYADHVDNLIFNIYLGQDTTPILSYPAWKQFSGGELQNLFPGNSFTYTTSPIALTLDQMRRIDTGAPIRVVLESYDYGADQQFYQDAVDAGLTVTIDTAQDAGGQPTHSYLLPIQGAQSIQSVLTQFFPAVYDPNGNIDGLWVPQYNSADQPTWVEHTLSTNSWWHIYLTQTLTSTTQLQTIPAQPGTSILIRFDQDSDNDGYPDRIEQQYGTNPNDPTSHPAPNLIAALVSTPTSGTVTPGTAVTAQLALENTGTFEAYGIQAVMYAPDTSTTVTDALVGGSGVVAPGSHVAVGSLVDAPNRSNWSTSTDAAIPYSGGEFTGTGDITYTFTVATAGGVGQTGTTMQWTSTAGGSGTLDLGTSYLSPTPIPVDQGVEVWFDSGALTAGTSFTVTAHAPEDTFRYVVNRVPYTPPVVVVSYSDPQGAHRFITPVQAPSLSTSLAADSSQMLRPVGIHIVPTGPVTTTGTNLTNIILESPATAPIQGGHVELDFTANGTVVDHIAVPVSIQPGPLVVPVSWSTASFSLPYDPTADNILIAYWTDGQGTIIDSTARPLDSFAADLTAGAHLASSTWNIGTVTQGAILTQTFPLANSGLVALDVGTSSADPAVAISGTGSLVQVPPLGTDALTLTLDTSTLSGTLSKTVTIPTSDPADPQAVITINGTVTPPSAAAMAFAVPNHPLDQLVRVYGTVPQYSTVAFTPTIQPDQATIEPCLVYDAGGAVLKGVGQLCTTFATGTSSAQLFGNGHDGDVTVSNNTDLNPVRASASGNAGATSLSISNITGAGFQAGQLVLIHQSQGMNAGQWELRHVLSASATLLTLTQPLSNTYLTSGNSHAQVQWVPQYHNLTIPAGVTVTPAPWNGTTGGIVAVLSNGVLQIDGAIRAAGFNGGTGYLQPPSTGGLGTGFHGGQGNTSQPGAQYGEGYPGPAAEPGRFSNNYGPNGNGGGATPYDNGGSGAGGGNGTPGGIGAGNGPTQGGLAYGSTDLTTVVFGGGGGGGTDANHAGGGGGGGMVFLFGKDIIIAGSGINANGGNGGSSNASGGGGAGGSVLLRGRSVMLGSGLVTANGGAGGTGGYAPGGAGGAGRIRVEYCDSLSGTTTPAASTQQLSCYIASKSAASTVQFTVPDPITNGQDYLVQMARHLTFDGTQPSQSNVIRIPAGSYAGATMNVLLTNLGAGGVANLGVSLGGVQVYSSTQTLTQSTTIVLPDVSSALNTYLQANPPVNGTVDVPVQISLAGQADVLLTNLVLTPGPAVDLAVGAGDLQIGCAGSCPVTTGATVPVTLTVHNTGSQDASGVIVGYFAGDPRNGGVLVGSSYLAGVPAGGSAPTTFAWDTTGFTGTQTLYAVVNPLHSLPETQFSNNTTSQTLGLNTGPDLQISSITFSSTSTVVGEPLTATIVLANTGQTAAPPSTTHLQVVGERGDSQALDLPTGAIAATSALTLQAPLAPTLFGTHVLTVTADATGVVAETNRANDTLSTSVVVGLGPQDIDAGGAADTAYTAAQGYGYLNGTAFDLGGSTITSTVRVDGGGDVQYRFDGLQPARAYHLDALFYQTSGSTFAQTVSFNGIDSGQVLSLVSGTPLDVSLLVPTAAYSGTTMVVSFQRVGTGNAYVSELALTPIQYTYIDAGGTLDTAYSAAQGYGYLGTDTLVGTLGGTDPVSTYRTALGSTLTYRFDGLSPRLRYQVDLTMDGGPTSTNLQSVSVDGTTVASCANLAVNVLQRVRCLVDPATYATDQSIQVTVTCVSCTGPIVNEVALEQITRLSGVSIPPLITTQPSSQTVTVGQSATFSATASGNPPPTVQWQLSTDSGATFAAITGAVTPTLILVPTTLAQTGSQYRAVFTNSAGSATTQAATLTVQPSTVTVSTPLVTDLTSSGFVATFNTSQPVTGWLIYGTSSSALSSTAYDDRDGSGPALTQSTVHRITLTGLTGGTTYFFEPVVSGTAHPGAGGAPSSQTVPILLSQPPLPHHVVGTVLLQDGSLPAANTVLLTGYWTNPDGSASAPVSVLNTTPGTQNLNYTFGATPLTQAGTAYFSLTVGTSVFHLSGAGDDGGQEGMGGPVTAPLSSTVTRMPTFALALVRTFALPVTAGWNLISLPLSPTTPLSAQTVLTTLLAQTGGGYAELDGYTNGAWTPSVFDDVTDGIGLNGGDFALQLGRGYALYSDTAGSITVTGTPPAPHASALPAGWSLVGFPDAATSPITADAFLTNLLTQTGGGYAEIDGYSNGQFAPSAFDDVAGGIGLNGNFPVQPGQGYAVYSDRAATQTFLAQPAASLATNWAGQAPAPREGAAGVQTGVLVLAPATSAGPPGAMLRAVGWGQGRVQPDTRTGPPLGAPIAIVVFTVSSLPAIPGSPRAPWRLPSNQPRAV